MKMTSTKLALLMITLILSVYFFALPAHADPIRVTVGQKLAITTTIASGQTTSPEVDLGGFTLNGIVFPATFTGTTVTFLMTNTSGSSYVQVYNSAGAVSYTAGGGRYLAVNAADFEGIRYLQIVSGSAEAAARTLGLNLKTRY